jgi:hypothetical protein
MENWRKKMAEIEFLMKWSLVATFRVQTIDKLDAACTNADDRIMPVRHRSGDRVMS